MVPQGSQPDPPALGLFTQPPGQPLGSRLRTGCLSLSHSCILAPYYQGFLFHGEMREDLPHSSSLSHPSFIPACDQHQFLPRLLLSLMLLKAEQEFSDSNTFFLLISQCKEKQLVSRSKRSCPHMVGVDEVGMTRKNPTCVTQQSRSLRPGTKGTAPFGASMLAIS